MLTTIAIVSLTLLSVLLAIALAVIIVAWNRLNDKYKEHLLLWSTVLSTWEEMSAQVAQVANKERVLLYAAPEAAVIGRIASAMLEMMVVASAQIGESTISVATQKVIRQPPAQTVASEDE